MQVGIRRVVMGGRGQVPTPRFLVNPLKLAYRVSLLVADNLRAIHLDLLSLSVSNLGSTIADDKLQDAIVRRHLLLNDLILSV